MCLHECLGHTNNATVSVHAYINVRACACGASKVGRINPTKLVYRGTTDAMWEWIDLQLNLFPHTNSHTLTQVWRPTHCKRGFTTTLLSPASEQQWTHHLPPIYLDEQTKTLLINTSKFSTTSTGETISCISLFFCWVVFYRDEVKWLISTNPESTALFLSFTLTWYTTLHKFNVLGYF